MIKNRDVEDLDEDLWLLESRGHMLRLDDHAVDFRRSGTVHVNSCTVQFNRNSSLAKHGT